MAYVATKIVSGASMPLTNTDVILEGDTVCLNTATGKAAKVSAITTLIPIGTAREDLTGTGTNLLEIQLFRELRLFPFANDGTNPVIAATRGSTVYLKDALTVSALGTGRSAAGRCWEIEGTTIWVEPAL